MLVGYLTNKILLPGFTPHFDLSKSQHAIGLANKLNFGLPDLVSYLCSILVLSLFFCLLAIIKTACQKAAGKNNATFGVTLNICRMQQ